MPTAKSNTKTKPQPGADIIVATAFELIGVGVVSLLAGINDQMGTICVIVMVGFLLGWLLLNSSTLAGWIPQVK